MPLTNKKSLSFIFKNSNTRLLTIIFILVFAAIGYTLINLSKAASYANANFDNLGSVNAADLLILSNHWGSMTATHDTGDADGDGDVDITDFAILTAQWGTTPTASPTPIPSPIVPPTSLNVKDYGAHADGTTNDEDHILSAISAANAAGKAVYLPTGIYYISDHSITIPANTTIIGDGMAQSWIKGQVKYGSNSNYSNLKIGDSGYSAIYGGGVSETSKINVTNTSFTNCHFRGGGGSSYNSNVISLGYYGDATYITFTGCEVERNLGTDSSVGLDYNCIKIYDGFANQNIHHITLDNIHVGVSNGMKTGAERMGMELWMNDGTSTIAYHDISIRNSTFEISDQHQIDFSDSELFPSYNLLIENNNFKGSYGSHGTDWGFDLDFEFGGGSAGSVIIRNNAFGLAHLYAIYVTDRGWSHSGNRPGMQIYGNKFYWDTANGVTPHTWNRVIRIEGDGSYIHDNEVWNHLANSSDSFLLGDGDTDIKSNNNTITGNTFHIPSGTGVQNATSGSGNVIAPNTATQQ